MPAKKVPSSLKCFLPPPLPARPPLQLHLNEHVEVFPGMSICIVHSTSVLCLFCMVAHFLKNDCENNSPRL